MAILTVSREFGSGGREIGKAVAGQTGYAYVNKETILEDIRKSGKKWEEWEKELDEHCPTVWEKYDWSFRGLAALVQSSILDHALNDRVVIMGRGGSFLLKGIPYAFRIRVVAPMESRLERIMSRESVDKETARWLAEKTDRDRACFIHTIYHKNWDDPAEFDRVFDTGPLSIDEIVSVVKDILAEKERFDTREAREVLRIRSVAARVMAGILTDRAFFVPTLDVYPDGKEVVLKGVIHNPKEHKRIEDKARSLSGDVHVRCELHYRK